MKIIIAGGTGFIGKALVHHYLTSGDEVSVIGRKKDKIIALFNDKVKAISWEEIHREGAAILSNVDLIINLTGENIGDKRWSKQRKQAILLSRIKATETLARLCARLMPNAPILFNTSAIGVYGLQDAINGSLPPALDENTLINFNTSPDFLSHVARQWELATLPATRAHVRVVNLRFGIVLGKEGVLKKLKPPYSFGLGGKIGSGNQPISWIALADLLRIFDFIYNHPEITGPVNCVAPECIAQKEFAKILAKTLHRPALGRMPAFLIKLLFGQMGEELLLKGQCVTPKILTDYHFYFQFPNLESALKEIYSTHD